jgi:hypothetical protein
VVEMLCLLASMSQGVSCILQHAIGGVYSRQPSDSMLSSHLRLQHHRRAHYTTLSRVLMTTAHKAMASASVDSIRAKLLSREPTEIPLTPKSAWSSSLQEQIQSLKLQKGGRGKADILKAGGSRSIRFTVKIESADPTLTLLQQPCIYAMMILNAHMI